jgi:cysteine desulfurase
VASIVALGAACAIAKLSLESEAARVGALRDRLWQLLSQGVPGIAQNGHPSERLPNTLNVRFTGLRGSALLAAAPEIAASTGSACHEGGETASAVRSRWGSIRGRAGPVRLTRPKTSA